MDTLDKVKAIIERHEKDLDKNGVGKADFENMIRDAIKENLLDDFLNVMFASNISIPSEVITKCLCERYIPKWTSLTQAEREKKICNITLAINKYQIAIFKAII